MQDATSFGVCPTPEPLSEYQDVMLGKASVPGSDDMFIFEN
jgi:hypothetical protein